MSDDSIHRAEQCVLGGILISCAPMPPALELLSPSDFADSRHAAVFAAMLVLRERNEPVDEITVQRELEVHASGPKSAWAQLLTELSDAVPTAANVEHYANLVRRDARRRDCATVMGEALHEAKRPGVDGDEIITRVVMELGRLAEDRALVRPALMRDLVREEFAAIEKRGAAGEIVGVPTGFSALDRVMGGLTPGGMCIIAARPSMGKSALATGMLANIAIRKGGAGLLFSLEMTREEQVQRMIASEARIDLNRVLTGRVSASEYRPLSQAADRLYTDRIAIVDKPGLSVAELRSIARQHATRHPLSVVVVDYLQLMDSAAGESREREVASISRGLKALAMELRVPLIALAQLNRSVESRQDKRPMLSDLRDSGSIEQDAHQVLFIYRDEYYHPKTDDPGIAEIGIAKNRNGPTGMVKLRWTGRCTRFDSLDEEQPTLPYGTAHTGEAA